MFWSKKPDPIPTIYSEETCDYIVWAIKQTLCDLRA